MPKFTNGEEYYNKLYIAFNGLIALTLIPFVLIFLDIEKNGKSESILSENYTVALAVISSVLYASLVYYFFYRYKIDKSSIPSNSSLRKKLTQYYSISLKLYLGLNSCCLLALTGLYLTRNFSFTIGYVLALILLSIRRPVLNTISKEIPLNDLELDILSNKKNID